MSHLATIEVKFDNKKYVEEAIKEMGFLVDSTRHVMTTDFRQSEEVELQVLNKDGKPLPIGFRLNNEGDLDLRADWWGLNINKEQFVENLKTLYSKHKVVDLASQQGFNLESSEYITNENGDKMLRLELSSWVDESTFASSFDSRL